MSVHFRGDGSLLCFVLAGRSYSVFSQRMLNQCLESLVQKIHSGVVINFEKTGPDPPPIEGESPCTRDPTPPRMSWSGATPLHPCG